MDFPWHKPAIVDPPWRAGNRHLVGWPISQIPVSMVITTVKSSLASCTFVSWVNTWGRVGGFPAVSRGIGYIVSNGYHFSNKKQPKRYIKSSGCVNILQHCWLNGMMLNWILKPWHTNTVSPKLKMYKMTTKTKEESLGLHMCCWITIRDYLAISWNSCFFLSTVRFRFTVKSSNPQKSHADKQRK